MLVPRLADDLEARLVERPAEIDAGDLGADVGVELGDGDAFVRKCGLGHGSTSGMFPAVRSLPILRGGASGRQLICY